MHSQWLKSVIAIGVVITMGALLVAQADKAPPAGVAMAQAALEFLASVPPDQQAKAKFSFDDAERLNWHFIPRERKGLPFREMQPPGVRAAHKLLASSLSPAGYEQALDVMSLEEVLFLIEGGDRAKRRENRDPKKYYISIFGTPSPTGKWGWRLEGHHISLNWLIENGQIVSSTPEFFGANPAIMDGGAGRVIRVLAPEEDIARQVLKLTPPDKMSAVLLDKKAPGEIRGANALQPDTTPAAGMPASQMNADQKKLLAELLNEYLKNMPADVSAKRRAAIEQAGMDKIHFAWWGGTERNEPYNYRVQGPTFLIEHNNTQSSANHIHSVWRDMKGDFGIAIK